MRVSLPYWEPIPDLEKHVTGHMDSILDGFLYLGDLESSAEAPRLENNITRVLSVIDAHMFQHLPVLDNAEDGLRIKMEDVPSQSLVQIVPRAIAFLRQCRADGVRVLVHCSAGISRSATIVIAYLILEHKMSLESAYIHVRARREVICPNLGFMQQLRVIQSIK